MRKESNGSEVSKETALNYIFLNDYVLLLYFETGKHISSNINLVLPVSAAYYRLVFSCFIYVYLRAIVIFHRQISLCNASRPTKKATGCEILLCVVLYLARSYILSRKNRLVMNLE